MIFAAAATMLAACNNGKTATNATGSDTIVTDSAIYEGITPAADCFGIRYRVALAQDSTLGFSLEEAYLKSENEVDTAISCTGVAEVKKVGEKTYYVLSAGKDAVPYNFLQLNDSTLRMVNADLEESVNKDLNYDLKLQR